jgi:hypothetical protein
MWSCDTCYLLGLVQTPAHRPDVGPVTVFGWPWSTGAGWFLVHVSGPSGARPFRATRRTDCGDWTSWNLPFPAERHRCRGRRKAASDPRRRKTEKVFWKSYDEREFDVKTS